MLRKFIPLSHKEDSTVFLMFWILFVLSFAFPFVKKMRAWGFAAFDSHIFLLGFLVLSASVGIAIWKLLQKDRLLSLRNVVIGLQGFILFLFVSIMIPVLIYGFFYLIFDRQIPETFLSKVPIVFAIFVVPGFFVAGCWLGFRIDKIFVLAAFGGIVLAALSWLTVFRSVPILRAPLRLMILLILLTQM